MLMKMFKSRVYRAKSKCGIIFAHLNVFFSLAAPFLYFRLLLELCLSIPHLWDHSNHFLHQQSCDEEVAQKRDSFND